MEKVWSDVDEPWKFGNYTIIKDNDAYVVRNIDGNIVYVDSYFHNAVNYVVQNFSDISLFIAPLTSGDYYEVRNVSTILKDNITIYSAGMGAPIKSKDEAHGTLTADSNVGDTRFYLDNVSGFDVGEEVKIGTSSTDSDYGNITNISTSGLYIDIDTPASNTHSTGDYASSAWDIFRAKSVNNIHIHHLRIDHNGTNYPVFYAVCGYNNAINLQTCNHSSVESVKIYDAVKAGVRILGGEHNKIVSTNVDKSLYYGLKMEGVTHGNMIGNITNDTGHAGIQIEGGTLVSVMGNNISYSSFFDRGIALEAFELKNITLVGNTLYNGGIYSGPNVSNTASYITILGNTLNNGPIAIYKTTYANILGNTIKDLDTSGGYDAISISLSDYAKVGNNVINGTALGTGATGIKPNGSHIEIFSNTINTMGNGIRIPSGNDDMKIYDNFLINTGTPYTNLGSTNIVLRDNDGIVSENSGTSAGTGAQQAIAHGLVDTPSKVILWNIDNGANPYQSAAADATYIYITAGSGLNYGWQAEV